MRNCTQGWARRDEPAGTRPTRFRLQANLRLVLNRSGVVSDVYAQVAIESNRLPARAFP